MAEQASLGVLEWGCSEGTEKERETPFFGPFFAKLSHFFYLVLFRILFSVFSGVRRPTLPVDALFWRGSFRDGRFGKEVGSSA